MRKVLLWTGLFLLCAFVALAETPVVKTTFTVAPEKKQYKITVKDPDGFTQLQLQCKISALITKVLEKESQGLHPYQELNEIKKLVKQLKD